MALIENRKYQIIKHFPWFLKKIINSVTKHDIYIIFYRNLSICFILVTVYFHKICIQFKKRVNYYVKYTLSGENIR